MEKIFSLDNMSKNIFTESTSTFREFPNEILSKNHSIYANAIKEAMAISDNTVKVNLEEAFKDSLYRIKETEKNISKNILFEDYAFNLKFVRPNISEINRPICVYHYKNLCNPDSPNLNKLNEYLDKFITVLSRFQSIGNPTDKQAFCEFLNEYSSKLLDECHNVNNDVLGCDDKDSMDDLDFIKNSYHHFRDLDTDPLGKEYSAGIPTRECVEYIKNEHLDIPTAVKGYNSNLTLTINKINKVLGLLNSIYTDYDFDVKEAKKKFKHALIVYTSKYLSRANIAYSVKYINVCEFLNPNNDSENRTDLVEGCDVLGDIFDNDLDDLLLESFDDIISNESEVYREPEYFVPKLMIMEAEFNGLLTQEIMNEADPPAPQQPANGNTTSNPPATTGTETKDENSIINSAVNKIKELWQIVRNFFLKLFGKMTTDANNISIKAQNINYQDVFKKYNGGQGFDTNVFPKLKGNNNYNTGIDNTLDFIKTKLPNISNNITNTLNFKDENATFTTEGFLQAIFGKPPQGDTSNLTVWAKNYFFGNDNLAQPDQEYQFGSGVSEEAFKKLQDFALEAGMNAKKLQDTQMEMCDKVSQYMINSINAVKHESDMIDVSKYHIERVLEEYFGKDYDILQEKFGDKLTEEQKKEVTNIENRFNQNTGQTSNNPKDQQQQDQPGKPKEQQQQSKPVEQTADNTKAKEKEAKTTKIINASKSFSKVIETLTSAAGTAINIIGNDWIRIVNIINNYETNQQNQQSGEAKQNTNPPQQVEQQNNPPQ